MKSLSEAIVKLEKFSDEKIQLSQIIDTLKKLKDGALSEDQITDLRKVLRLLEESENNVQHADAAYHALLAIAETNPINQEDPITLDTIDVNNRVTVSTGHQFDIISLAEHIRQKQAFINPFTNLPFSPRDQVTIQTLFKNKNIEFLAPRVAPQPEHYPEPGQRIRFFQGPRPLEIDVEQIVEQINQEMHAQISEDLREELLQRCKNAMQHNYEGITVEDLVNQLTYIFNRINEDLAGEFQHTAAGIQYWIRKVQSSPQRIYTFFDINKIESTVLSAALIIGERYQNFANWDAFRNSAEKLFNIFLSYNEAQFEAALRELLSLAPQPRRDPDR